MDDPSGAPDADTTAAGNVDDYSEQNRKNRAHGIQLLPHADRIAEMTIVLLPLQMLLRETLRAGGLAFEASQRHDVLRANDADPATSRLTRLGMAAECQIEDGVSQKILSMLKQPESWLAVPPSRMTIGGRSDMFALLSRAGGLIQQLLRSRHQAFPFRLFRLLRHPEELDAVKSSLPCMQCPFTQKFLERYGQSLGSVECRASLHVLSVLAVLDIAAVEVGHGRIRRRLIAASNNNWRQHVVDTSSDFVLRDLHRRDQDHARLHGEETFHGKRGSQCKRSSDPPEVHEEPAQQKQKIGPFRAFIRDQSDSGVVRTFGGWAADYGELSETERAAYTVMARSFDDADAVQDGEDGPQRPAKRTKASEVGVRARWRPPSFSPL